ncbi:transglycosylase domain-containing protein [Candidatus Clostridium radicumherbarum]|uniref:Penicillin-binding protein 1A n=1 Tax=Candidatus Clostridium radicumherbarum TaxID=3381662 RepID=A0ABW8TR34_9CLOT
MTRRNGAKKKKKTLKHIFIALCLIVLLIISVCASFLFSFSGQIQAAKQEATDKISSINDNTFKRVGPTIIYDKDGNQITKLSSSSYTYTNYNDIPDLVKEAFVATEDKDFYKNNGISVRGMARALVSYIENKGKITQGGSTITQQLVKNVLLTQDKTWSRKLTEILISVQLEKQFSKEQILEYYLNNINFSNGAYSIASAAHTYFNKSLNELNLAEITFLAAIPNNPTYYNPLKYYDHVIDRQHLMLSNLKAQNYITDKQYQDALNTKVVLNYQPPQSVTENYMTSYAVDSAVRALMQNDNFNFQYQFASDADRSSYEDNYNEVYADYEKKVRNGGYKIYTSFDVNLQNQLQTSLDNGLSNFYVTDPKTGLYKMQGAGVCIDNSTGEVVAAVGGRSQSNITNYFNRAFQAVRQPGSAIKPVLVYAPAFDDGYTPDSTMVDQYIPNGPKNDENTFFGKVTLRFATELSLNTVAYQLLQKETTQYALPYLYKMDFAHIVSADNSPIIGIGGFTYGVTPIELASAYSTLARGGEFITPTCITKIEDENQNCIYQNTMNRTRIYKEDSAYYMTDVLKGVLTKSSATGYGLGLNNMIAAGKTGTTSSSKDGWFAGYTPYLTTVVWAGYDTPTSISDLYGATYPGRIWQDFMNKANKGLQPKDFNVPADIQQQIDENATAAAQTEVTDAENAVSAYENIHLSSKNDYAAADSALQNAQSTVNKISDDQKQSLQNRINAKTAELNQEKQAIDAASQSSVPSTQTGNNSGTDTNNNVNNNGGGTNSNINNNNNIQSGTVSNPPTNNNDTKSQNSSKQ